MLHTLNQSPWHHDLSAPLRLVGEGDDLLLLSDGVLAGLKGSRFLDLLQDAPITLYALEDDIAARGLATQISDSIVRISYTEFVRLTVKHGSQLSW